MTTHTTPDELLALEAGQTATITGDVFHVGPLSVDATDLGGGRVGRTVTLFVESDEDPSEPIGATFSDLLVEPGSLEHAQGSGMPTPDGPTAP